MNKRLSKAARIMFLAMLGAGAMVSCTTGDLANIEVDITDVKAAGGIEGVVKKDIQENKVVVYLDTTKVDMSNLTLDYAVSEDATWEYVVPNAKQDATTEDISADHYDAAGKTITDYTQPVYIRVTAGRGIDPSTNKTWCKVWKITTQALTDNMPTKFSFDNWEMPTGCAYYMPIDYIDVNGVKKPIRMWDSTCGSLTPIWSFVYGDNLDYTCYASQPTDDAVSGKAMKLLTSDISWADPTKPYISGCTFLGTFKGEIGDDQLKTQVGQPFNKRPTTLKFYYKYAPGTVAATGKTDTGFIRAVLFRTDSQTSYLTGYTIKDNTFANTVAYAEFDPSSTVSEYQLQEIPFTYTQDVNDEDLKNWQYSIAIYFASSLGGFTYSGCGGTTLWIDELELVCE